MSHTEIVLKHLKRGSTLTSMQAFSRYGITRLSGRIYDLRKQGWRIDAPMKRVKSRNGDYARVAVYRLNAHL